MKRKGVMGAFVTFMVVIVVFVLGAGWGMFMYSSGLSDTLYINMNDLNSISEADTYGDYYEETFIPRVINLSEQRAAYDLADEEAGMTWSRSTVPFSDPHSAAAREMEPVIQDMIDHYMGASSDQIRCTVDNDYSINVDEDSNTLTGSRPNVTCSATSTVSATYGLETEFVQDHPTRFLKMVEDMNELAENTKEELPGSEITAEGSASTGCETDGVTLNERRGIRSSAKSNARTNTIQNGHSYNLNNAPSRAESNTDFYPDFELEESSISFYPSATEAVINNDKTGSESCQVFVGCPDGETLQRDGSCSGGSDPYEDGTEYTAYADYTLEDIEVDYRLNDTRQKFLTDDGAQYIMLEITYDHPLG